MNAIGPDGLSVDAIDQPAAPIKTGCLASPTAAGQYRLLLLTPVPALLGDCQSQAPQTQVLVSNIEARAALGIAADGWQPSLPRSTMPGYVIAAASLQFEVRAAADVSSMTAGQREQLALLQV